MTEKAAALDELRAMKARGEIAETAPDAPAQDMPDGFWDEAEKVAPLNAGEQMALCNILIAMKGPLRVRCQYTNWRGEKAERHLRIIKLWHGATEWHPKPGLMLKAIDLEKGKERDFCVADFDTSTLRIA